MPESEATIPGTGNFSGIYFQLGLSHRLNQYVDYSLNLGRSVNFALSGGTIDLYYARWAANWKIFRKTFLSTSFDYENGSQIGSGGEKFTRYGPGITLGRPLTDKLSGSVGCQYYWRGSNLAGRDYTAY